MHRHSSPTRREVFDYIEGFYNRQRRQSTLAMLSPANYEKISLSLTHTQTTTTRQAAQAQTSPPNPGKTTGPVAFLDVSERVASAPNREDR